MLSLYKALHLDNIHIRHKLKFNTEGYFAGKKTFGSGVYSQSKNSKGILSFETSTYICT